MDKNLVRKVKKLPVFEFLMIDIKKKNHFFNTVFLFSNIASKDHKIFLIFPQLPDKNYTHIFNATIFSYHFFNFFE
jgi:hypothetical protein